MTTRERNRRRRGTTLAQFAQAHVVIVGLLAEGPEAVWPARIARRMGRSRSWVSRGLGDRDTLLRNAVAREVAALCGELRSLGPLADPRHHIRAVVHVLLGPPTQYRARLWILELASRCGLGVKRDLAQAISTALSGSICEDAPAIGGGVLGVMGEALGPWNPAREQLEETLNRMVLAVHFFEVAARRARKG